MSLLKNSGFHIRLIIIFLCCVIYTVKAIASKIVWPNRLWETYCNKEFPYPDIEMERSVFKSIELRPFKQALTCVAIPWGVFINGFVSKNKLDLSGCSYSNAFTFCVPEAYELLIPFLKKANIKYLFTTQRSRVKADDIIIVPILYPPTKIVRPAFTKDILYSFIGFKSHPLRNRIFEFKSIHDVIIKQRRSFHYFLNKKKLLDQFDLEYKDILSRSRFSLCPRGNSSNTFRLTESIFAGAIPVVIADDIVLPAGWNWNECLIQVREQDANKIDEIIRSISLEREEKMRRSCFELARILEDDPAYFIRYYFDHKYVCGKDIMEN